MWVRPRDLPQPAAPGAGGTGGWCWERSTGPGGRKLFQSSDQYGPVRPSTAQRCTARYGPSWTGPAQRSPAQKNPVQPSQARISAAQSGPSQLPPVPPGPRPRPPPPAGAGRHLPGPGSTVRGAAGTATSGGHRTGHPPPGGTALPIAPCLSFPIASGYRAGRGAGLGAGAGLAAVPGSPSRWGASGCPGVLRCVPGQLRPFPCWLGARRTLQSFASSCTWPGAVVSQPWDPRDGHSALNALLALPEQL